MARFTQLADEMFAAYGAGDFELALQLVLDALPDIADDDLPAVEWWRVCLNARTGRTDEAIRVMADIVERGWWYGEGMLQDSDLDSLRTDIRWRELAAECAMREQTAMPASTVFIPRRSDGHGTVVALHAAGGRPSHTAAVWQPATEMGFDLLAPSGSTMVSHDSATWGSIEDVDADLSHELGDLSKPLIFAGRSRGAVRAAQLGERWDDVVGVILVAHAPTPESCPSLTAPTFLVSGADDEQVFLDAVDRFAAYQISRGIPIASERLDGMGHLYPDDFERLLNQAIRWISSHA